MSNATERLFVFASALVALVFPRSSLIGQEKAPAAAAQAGGETVQMNPWTVTSSREHGYGATDSMAGSRISLPLVDVPMSVITVNRQLLDDTGQVDPLGALLFVSGMGPASTATVNSMTLRGIETRAYSFNLLDGLPSGGYALTPIQQDETEFIDRYEVVKGAAGTLYGDHSIGGLINRIFKRPLPTRQTTIKTWYSDIGNTWQGSVDTTGPVDSAGQLQYRLVGVYRDGETEVGGADSKKGFYGTLQYSPKSGRTQFWARASRNEVDTGHETPGAIVDGTGHSSLPYFGIERTVPIANDQTHTSQYYEFGFNTGTRGLLGSWDLRFVGRANRVTVSAPLPEIIPTGYTFYDAAGNSLGSISTAANPVTQPSFATVPWADVKLTSHADRSTPPSTDETRGIFVDLTGSFDTGPMSHRALLYVQAITVKSRAHSLSYRLKSQYGGAANTGNLNAANAFSLVNPVYRTSSLDMFENPTVTSDSASSGSRYDVGLQDNIYLLNKRLLLVGGVRYDFVENNGTDNYITGAAGKTEDTSDVVSKASVVVKPFTDRNVSIFANYSETFQPQFGELIVGSGIPFKNLEGQSREVGLKLELMDSHLLATASYFKSELKNNPIIIFNTTTGLNDTYQIGVTHIKGWEGDLTWTISENWAALVAMSDVESVNANGTRPRNVQNGFNYRALLRYTASRGSRLEGFSGGLDAINISDRYGDATNTYITPGYTTFDAFAGYGRKNWRVHLNVYNLTDKEALLSSIFQALLTPANPRSVRVTFEYDF